MPREYIGISLQGRPLQGRHSLLISSRVGVLYGGKVGKLGKNKKNDKNKKSLAICTTFPYHLQGEAGRAPSVSMILCPGPGWAAPEQVARCIYPSMYMYTYATGRLQGSSRVGRSRVGRPRTYGRYTGISPRGGSRVALQGRTFRGVIQAFRPRAGANSSRVGHFAPGQVLIAPG